MIRFVGRSHHQLLNRQEIEVKRASPSERLGMTLCYEDEDAEGNTEIFIDDIAPEGLAARDGRLRLGDQIIQINGVKVKTKAAAQEMFLTITGDVSLLVVRPPVLGGAGYEEVSVEKERGMQQCILAAHKHSHNTFGMRDGGLECFGSVVCSVRRRHKM